MNRWWKVAAILLACEFGIIIGYWLPERVKPQEKVSPLEPKLINPEKRRIASVESEKKNHYEIRVEGFSDVEVEYAKIEIGNRSISLGAILPWQSASDRFAVIEVPDTVLIEWRYENDEILYKKKIHLVYKDIILTDYSDSFHGFVFCIAEKDCFMFYQFDTYFSNGEFGNSYWYFSVDGNRRYYPSILKRQLWNNPKWRFEQ